ncbi:MAG: hypothetical protein FWG58_04560 [Methanomassiliicoccaceae archaeon]|nr:hypothetical protein [Methanomassiliicoccaceae archaeon]
MREDRGWRRYRNGNVIVTININDGTKIRRTEDDEFDAVFPESVDMKITNRCKIGCKMCHEESSENGAHADLSRPDETFLGTLRPYTEIAIGGGSVTSHPQIEEFLRYLKKRKVLANITVHERELKENEDTIQGWIDTGLVKGVGISVHSHLNDLVCDFAMRNVNAVLHVIAGLTPLNTMLFFGNKRLKLLILGYKNWGRGSEYYEEHRKEVEDGIRAIDENIEKIFRTFQVVSFDNLALMQLNVKEHVTEDEWNTCYQGHDATHTMYVDLVKQEYAATSTSGTRYKISGTIDEMFASVKGTMDHMI